MIRSADRKPKRSRAMSLLLVGGASFALAGCFPDRRDTVLFDTPDQCEAASGNSSAFWKADDCADAFAVARAEHVQTAPRYDSLQLCEEQHGAGNCGTGGDPVAGVAQSGGGSVFLPLMAGYMMGNMMAQNRAGLASRPLYPTAGGTLATANGASFARTGVITSTAATTFTRPAAVTAGQPPMTRATVARTGGFGTTAAAPRAGGSMGG